MEPMEKSDSYGEWIIRKVQQEAGGPESFLPAEVIAAARMVWPRVAAVVAKRISPSGTEKSKSSRVPTGIVSSVTSKAPEILKSWTRSVVQRVGIRWFVLLSKWDRGLIF